MLIDGDTHQTYLDCTIQIRIDDGGNLEKPKEQIIFTPNPLAQSADRERFAHRLRVPVPVQLQTVELNNLLG